MVRYFVLSVLAWGCARGDQSDPGSLTLEELPGANCRADTVRHSYTVVSQFEMEGSPPRYLFFSGGDYLVAKVDGGGRIDVLSASGTAHASFQARDPNPLLVRNGTEPLLAGQSGRVTNLEGTVVHRLEPAPGELVGFIPGVNAWWTVRRRRDHFVLIREYADRVEQEVLAGAVTLKPVGSKLILATEVPPPFRVQIRSAEDGEIRLEWQPEMPAGNETEKLVSSGTWHLGCGRFVQVITDLVRPRRWLISSQLTGNGIRQLASSPIQAAMGITDAGPRGDLLTVWDLGSRWEVAWLRPDQAGSK